MGQLLMMHIPDPDSRPFSLTANQSPLTTLRNSKTFVNSPVSTSSRWLYVIPFSRQKWLVVIAIAEHLSLTFFFHTDVASTSTFFCLYLPRLYLLHTYLTCGHSTSTRQARRTRALPARNTLTDENAPTTRSRTTAVVKPGVSASNAPVKPSMSRTTSSASTVVVRKPVSTATAGKGDVNAKQPTAGTSRMAGTKQEAGVRNRAALGELTNKDAVNVTNGDKPKVAGGKTTSTVTGRPIIARRTTRSSLATTDKPAEGVVEPTAGPSRSTITSTARARPAARTRPSAKNVNVKEEAVKREPLVGKATSSTVNNARAGIKRTLTATTVVQPSAPVPEAAPVRLERQTSVKREFEEPQGDDLENPIQPSSKRIRTSSPVKRDDAEFEREPEFEHGLVDVQEEQVRPAATREAGVDALEDEQPYELEEDAIGMSGGRLGDIVQDIDADDSDDPTMVVEYVQDIFNYMKELEVSRQHANETSSISVADLARPCLPAVVGLVHAQH